LIADFRLQFGGSVRKLFALLSFFLFLAPVWAQERVKIGVVDIQRVIQESQPGKRAKENFQAQVKKVEAELLKEKEAVEKLKADFGKRSLLLREEERRNLEKEIQKRERGYILSTRDFQEELRQRENELMSEIFRDIVRIVTEVGKKEGFALILEKSQVPYSDQAMDVTNKIIELYDSRTAGETKRK